MKCPVCAGELKRRKTTYRYLDIEFGKYDADVCEKCGEAFFTEESSDAIDRRAKELEVWGLKEHTRIGYSGNSLMVRIPKDIVEFMHLKKGEAVTISPVGREKLLIEAE